jgi:hypothetical protein
MPKDDSRGLLTRPEDIRLGKWSIRLGKLIDVDLNLTRPGVGS